MNEINDRTYHAEIAAIAKSALTEYPDSVDTCDAIHELCNDHEWVIYTYRAYQVCALRAPCWAEYEEDCGAKPHSIEALACWQMIADASERVAEIQEEAEEGAK